MPFDAGARPLTRAMRHSYARMAMRDWRPPPGLGFWGEKRWEAWALAYALDRVDDDRIQGRHECRDGRLCVTLDGTVPQPEPTDALVAEWRQARGHG